MSRASSNAADTRDKSTISSFFTPIPSPAKSTVKAEKKRATSPIDLTLSGDELPVAKKRRTVETRSRFFSQEDSREQASSTSSASQTRLAGPADQWRFEAPSPERLTSDTAKAIDPAERAKRKAVREAFKKKLLGENNPFAKKHSANALDGDDPDAMLFGGSDSEFPAISSRTSSKQTLPQHLSEDGDSGTESDPQFKALIGNFANKKAGKKGKGRIQSAPAKKKKTAEIGPSGETWTPLELQVLELKKINPGVLLMVEVGYKYRFYGEDAKIASKELGIMCFPYRNFLSASIPVHRRDVHIKKLLSQGHKVGIVDQTETAALKSASDNRNTLFTRGLSHLYTATTYVDELDSVDEFDRHTPPSLICLVEQLAGGMGADERVRIGMVSITPSTGDVIWDDFEDGYVRTELETRLVHTKPSELLLPAKELSKTTEKMLAHFIGYSSGGSKSRIERSNNNFSYTDAFAYLDAFYTENEKNLAAAGKLMAAVTDFPKAVVITLARAIAYLRTFSIADAFLQVKFFGKFTTKAHMLLNGNTLANLEIYENQTDYSTKGSLLWILDKTVTKFGARLLKSWVGRPLVDRAVLQERIDTVEELRLSPSGKIPMLRQAMRGLPDLAKGLSRIQYGKATPQELASILRAFNRLSTTFEKLASPEDAGFKSKTFNNILYTLPQMREPVKKLLAAISLEKAKEGKKEEMWTDPEKYPKLDEILMMMEVTHAELREELRSIRKTLKQPALQWTTVLKDEFLVEIRKSEDRLVPTDWTIVSSTRNVRRYYTPGVKTKVQDRARCVEALQAEADRAYISFLEEIANEHYALFRDVVNKLAVADCLLSLAHVALQPGYVKPEFTDIDAFEIINGRHPTLEALRSDPFVPNSCLLGGEHPRSKIITGPNMGGKSSCVRMIALISIMAQIGAYVPADSVKISMLDSVLTRMGAFDELAKGRSTFMVEMAETSDILRTATDKSLVILDELGRGTSTYDGMAIASAVLQHLVQTVRCKTLFITHYPLVANDLQKQFPKDLENVHMGFTEDARVDGTREITFLYKLSKGMASGSFGVECGRLAALPENILDVAASESASLRNLVEHRLRRTKLRSGAILLQKCLQREQGGNGFELDELRHIIDELQL